LTGDQLAFALRRLEPDIKVLFFTGFGDEQFKEKRRLAAYEAYVDKPVTVKGCRKPCRCYSMVIRPALN
jgi:hypothetical protein